MGGCCGGCVCGWGCGWGSGLGWTAFNAPDAAGTDGRGLEFVLVGEGVLDMWAGLVTWNASFIEVKYTSRMVSAPRRRTTSRPLKSSISTR